MADGSVKCWGGNTWGQLGDGTNTDTSIAVDVVGVSGAIEITAGAHHTCAVLSTGTAKCWGYNSFYGQLGDGTNVDSNVPVDVIGVSTATQITGGGLHTCAVLLAGSGRCWGWNMWGQLGDGTNTDSNAPVEVVGLSDATQIAAGERHTCAVLEGGTARCWGLNGWGQLGDGRTGVASNIPVDVIGLP